MIMNYGYLPLPIYLAICITLSVTLIITSIKRRKIDRKGLIVVYITISISGFITFFLKIQDEIGILNSLHDIMVYILAGILILMFIELIYLLITHKGTRELKKRMYIGLYIIIFSLLLGGVMFLILEYFV